MRFNEIAYPYMLTENARIQHAEDIIFFEGSAGAKRVIASLRKMAQDGHKSVTVKWDGSPAIVFGRDENGNFILTDKSGFTAKGYDGKAKSADHLEQMLKNRPGYAKNPEGYGPFIQNMKTVYSMYEKAVPQDYRGYFSGDLLYFSKPELIDGFYVFKPNIVEYSVDASSDLGKRIAISNTGVVVHREKSLDGTETAPENLDVLTGSEVLVVPPVTAVSPVDVDSSILDKASGIVNKYNAQLDELFNVSALSERKIKDFPGILYRYANSKVDTGFENLGKDFVQWLESSNVSARKQGNIKAYINEHESAFNALWDVYNTIIKVKDSIINQFDNQPMPVKQRMSSGNNSAEGGEGYVLAHPEGDIKLVPRQTFSKFNRAAER